jgi:hypothetical protein
MHHTRKATAALVALTLMCGCNKAAQTPSVVVRDSAGIKIVETSTANRVAAPITLEERASFAVGEMEGEPQYLLSSVVGALQLSENVTVIANRGTNELRFYDKAGKWLKSEGREGEGPGEYEYLRALGRCRAEGFVGFDLHWQVNAYDANGTFQEKSVLRAPDGISPYNLACDDHGHFLILGWGRGTQAPQIGFHALRDHLVLASSNGTIATDFGQRLASERIGNERGSRPHPAGRATLFALHNDVVYIGSGERFELELYDLTGGLRKLLRGPAIPLKTTDSVKTAYTDLALARISPERQPALRNEIAKWEWPASFPAYTKLIVDHAGVAWVRAFQLDPRASEAWSLLDPERGYLGDVTLPAGLSLLEAGPDYLLVLQRDSLDIESVLKFRMTRAK